MSQIAASKLRTFAAVRASNAKFAPATRPVIVVMGGTNGIGEGIARAFAKHTPPHIGAHIILVGRSQTAADAIIASLPAYPVSKYEFVPLEGTSMRAVRRFARDLVARLDKINYLVLSQGAFPNLAAAKTEDGLDPSMALMMHGRARAALDLAPLLEAAAERGEEARVMLVANAGVGRPLNLDDVELKKMSFREARGILSTYTDIITLELAARLPRASITHVYPGFVHSGFSRGMPLALRLLAAPFMWLKAIPAADCGEWMLSILLDPETKTGAWFRRDHGELVPPSEYASGQARDVVWRYVEEKSDVQV